MVQYGHTSTLVRLAAMQIRFSNKKCSADLINVFVFFSLLLLLRPDLIENIHAEASNLIKRPIRKVDKKKVRIRAATNSIEGKKL